MTPPYPPACNGWRPIPNSGAGGWPPLSWHPIKFARFSCGRSRVDTTCPYLRCSCMNNDRRSIGLSSVTATSCIHLALFRPAVTCSVRCHITSLATPPLDSSFCSSYLYFSCHFSPTPRLSLLAPAGGTQHCLICAVRTVPRDADMVTRLLPPVRGCLRLNKLCSSSCSLAHTCHIPPTRMRADACCLRMVYRLFC